MRGDEELRPIADACAEWFVERFLDCFGIDAEPEPIHATDLSSGQTQIDLRWAGVVWNIRFDPTYEDDDARFMMLDAADDEWQNSEDFAATAAGILITEVGVWQERYNDLNTSYGYQLARQLP